MRVAVLKGGWSNEREVSLVSGKACAAGLREAGFDTVEIDAGRDIAQRLVEVAPDACLNALHGPIGEDGSIQGLLNILDIPYTHSGVAASAIAMDKPRSKLIAESIGIRCPAGRLMNADMFFATTFDAPYVIKPTHDGSSLNTFVVRDPVVRPLARPDWPFRSPALVESFVSGVELTVTVLVDRALVVTEILPSTSFYDYEAKYAQNGSKHVIPARIPEAVTAKCLQQALAMHDAIGARGITRSDFIFDQNSEGGGLYFLEINTQPGMTPTSLAPEQARRLGIPFPELMRFLVEVATTDERYRQHAAG